MHRMLFDFTLLKRGFWVAYVLLLTLIVMLGVEMVQIYRQAQRPTPFSLAPAPPSAIPELPPHETVTDYQIIAARNIFHVKKEPSACAPTPLSVAQPIQALPLQMKLVGTVPGPQSHQYAILADLRSQGAQAIYQIGDTVQQALLAAIQPMCVVLETGSQSKTLCFPTIESAANSANRATTSFTSVANSAD